MKKNNDNTNIILELASLSEAGKYKEALEKHLWFHDASKDMPGMGGVRLSYALGLWKKLAEQYPPAMESLVNLRNNKRDILLKGIGTFDDFHDLSAINRELEETDDTVLVFIQIHKDFPEQSKKYYHVIEDLLVTKKEFGICDQCMVDPYSRYSEIEYLHQTNMRLMKKNPKLNERDFREYSEKSYIKSVCRLLEILIGLNKNDIANDIQTKSLEYFDNKTVRAII